MRTLRRAPVFTSVAVLCLTLGIAASTTMFSVFDAIVLRPLPFAQPEQLVSLGLRDARTGRRASLRYTEYVELRREVRLLSAVGAHAGRPTSITESREPERVSGRLVSANLFPLLGTRAQLGRLFVPDDERPGTARVVVIGDALWRRRYGGDSTVVGRTISLDGVPYTIVGVVDPGFAFPSQTELWTPIGPALATMTAQPRGVSVVGRRRADVDSRQVAEEVRTLGARIARGLRASVADSAWVGEVRPLGGTRLGSDEAVISAAMLGATTFLLLIACANVANLLLTRAVAREREIAVRAALGAGRGRIAAQLLTESLFIAITACAVALPIVWQALRLIKGAIPPSDPFPYYMEWSLDRYTFLFAAAAAVITGMVFGVGPALQATRGRLQDALKEGAQGTGTSRGRRAVRHSLVTGEVALALVLLVGGALFVRTFVGLRRTELGYDASRVMTMRFYLAGARYDSVPTRLALVDDVLHRVSAVPGVDAAAVSDLVPLDDEGGSMGGAVPEGREQERLPSVAYAAITEGWFASLGVGTLAGHMLSAGEQRGGTPVAVVNQTMARTFWPGTSPVGRRFRFSSDTARRWYEVVGVVPDIRTVKLDEDQRTPPTAYVPLRFVPTRDYALMVHTRLAPASLTGELRAAIHAADPVAPVFNTWTMEQVRYLSFWMYALWGTLFAVFGGIALVLATIGVYGVIHYGVSQRTREIGVRVALGAQRSDVLRLVLGQGVILAGVGVALGLVGAFALTRVVESFLIGVSPTDPASFVGVSVLLIGVAALATYLPARRATGVDPLIALRQE